MRIRPAKCGGGSIESNSLVRDPFREEQLLQSLLVFDDAWTQRSDARGRMRSADARMP